MSVWSMQQLIKFLDDSNISESTQRSPSVSFQNDNMDIFSELPKILMGDIDTARHNMANISTSPVPTMLSSSSSSTSTGQNISTSTLQTKPKKKISVTSVSTDVTRTLNVVSPMLQQGTDEITTPNTTSLNIMLRQDSESSLDPRLELIRTRSLGQQRQITSPLSPITINNNHNTDNTVTSSPPRTPVILSSGPHIPTHIVRRHLALAKLLHRMILQEKFSIEKAMLLLLELVALLNSSNQPTNLSSTSSFTSNSSVLPSFGMIEDSQLLSHPVAASHFLTVFINEAPSLMVSMGKFLLHRLQHCSLLLLFFPSLNARLQELRHMQDGDHYSSLLDAPNFGAETWTMNNLLTFDFTTREGEETRKDLKTKEAKAIYTERENCFDAFKSLLHRCEGQVYKANLTLLSLCNNNSQSHSAHISSSNSNTNTINPMPWTASANSLFAQVYEQMMTDLKKCFASTTSKAGGISSGNHRIVPSYRENWSWFAGMLVDKLLGCIIDNTERYFPSQHSLSLNTASAINNNNGSNRNNNQLSKHQIHHAQFIHHLLSLAVDTWMSWFAQITTMSQQIALVHIVLDVTLRKLQSLWTMDSSANTETNNTNNGNTNNQTASQTTNGSTSNSQMWQLRFHQSPEETFSGRLFCVRMLGKWIHRLQSRVLPEMLGYSLIAPTHSNFSSVMLGCYLPWEEWCLQAMQQGTMSLFVTGLVEVLRPVTDTTSTNSNSATNNAGTAVNNNGGNSTSAMLMTKEQRQRLCHLLQYFISHQILSPLVNNNQQNHNSASTLSPVSMSPRSPVPSSFYRQQTPDTATKYHHSDIHQVAGLPSNRLWAWFILQDMFKFPALSECLSSLSATSRMCMLNTVMYNYSEESVDAQSWAWSSVHFCHVHCPQFLLLPPPITVAPQKPAYQSNQLGGKTTTVQPRTGAAATFQTLTAKSLSTINTDSNNSNNDVHNIKPIAIKSTTAATNNSSKSNTTNNNNNQSQSTLNSSIVRNLFKSDTSENIDDNNNNKRNVNTMNEIEDEDLPDDNNVMALLLASCLAETQSVSSVKSTSPLSKPSNSISKEDNKKSKMSAIPSSQQQYQQQQRHRAISSDSLYDKMTLNSTSTTATQQTRNTVQSQSLFYSQQQQLVMPTNGNINTSNNFHNNSNNSQQRTLWAPSPTSFRLAKTSPHTNTNNSHNATSAGNIPGPPLIASRQVSTASYTTTLSNHSHIYAPHPPPLFQMPSSSFNHHMLLTHELQHSSHHLQLQQQHNNNALSFSSSNLVVTQTLQAMRLSFWERQKTLQAVHLFMVQNYCDTVMMHIRRLLEKNLPSFSSECDALLTQPMKDDISVPTVKNESQILENNTNATGNINNSAATIDINSNNKNKPLREEDMYVHFSQLLHTHAEPSTRKVCEEGVEAFQLMEKQSLQQLTSIFQWHNVPKRVLQIAIFLTAQTLSYWQQRFMLYLQEYCQRKFDETIAFKVSKYLEKQRELRNRTWLANNNTSNITNNHSNKPVKISYASITSTSTSAAAAAAAATNVPNSFSATDTAQVTIGIPVPTAASLLQLLTAVFQRLIDYEIVQYKLPIEKNHDACDDILGDNIHNDNRQYCALCGTNNSNKNSNNIDMDHDKHVVCILGKFHQCVIYTSSKPSVIMAASTTKAEKENEESLLKDANKPSFFTSPQRWTSSAFVTASPPRKPQMTNANTDTTTSTSITNNSVMPEKQTIIFRHFPSCSLIEEEAAVSDVPPGLHRRNECNTNNNINDFNNDNSNNNNTNITTIRNVINRDSTQEPSLLKVVSIDPVQSVNMLSLGLNTWQKYLLLYAQYVSHYCGNDTQFSVVSKVFRTYCASIYRHFQSLSNNSNAHTNNNSNNINSNNINGTIAVKLKGTLSMSLVQLLPLLLLVDYHASRYSITMTNKENTELYCSLTASFVHAVLQRGLLTQAQVSRALQAIARAKIAAYFEHCRGVKSAQGVLRPLTQKLETALVSASDLMAVDDDEQQQYTKVQLLVNRVLEDVTIEK